MTAAVAAQRVMAAEEKIPQRKDGGNMPAQVMMTEVEIDEEGQTEGEKVTEGVIEAVIETGGERLGTGRRETGMRVEGGTGREVRRTMTNTVIETVVNMVAQTETDIVIEMVINTGVIGKEIEIGEGTEGVTDTETERGGNIRFATCWNIEHKNYLDYSTNFHLSRNSLKGITKPKA